MTENLTNTPRNDTSAYPQAVLGLDGQIPAEGYAGHEYRDDRVLRPMRGLEITVPDDAVGTEVERQVVGLRNYLETGGSAEQPVRDTAEALGQLSDLAFLHLNEVDLQHIERSLAREGKPPREIDTAMHSTLERMARVLEHSMKGDEVFGHSIYKDTPGLFEKILKSGALKTKQGVAREHGRLTGVTSGNHSQMIHMRQETAGETFYFGAGSLIEAAPYVSAGIDDYIGGSPGVVSGMRNRIRGEDEAHAGPGGEKYAFTGVDISVDHSLWAALPRVEGREARKDISFMASTESPEAAGAYEFGLEDATIILRSPSIQVESDTPTDSREAALIHELDNDISGYKDKVATLARSTRQTGLPDYKAAGIADEDKAVWSRMMGEIEAVQNQYDEFSKASGRNEMIRGAMATALAREKARLIGVDEKIVKNIYVMEITNPLDLTSRDFAKFREAKKNPPTRRFVDYKTDILKFSQKELVSAS